MSNPETEKPISSEQIVRQARLRVAEMEALYEDLRKVVSRQIAELGPVTAQGGKKTFERLGELLTVHLKVIEAQEKFHARFTEDKDQSGLDYDAIRDEIGSALDRIRAASNPDSVSKGSDKG